MTDPIGPMLLSDDEIQKRMSQLSRMVRTAKDCVARARKNHREEIHFLHKYQTEYRQLKAELKIRKGGTRA